jgi:type IV pilus assembly protein PilM
LAALTNLSSWRDALPTNHRVRHFLEWMDDMAHPSVAIEFGRSRITAVRWARTGAVDGVAVVPLPAGALVPSPVETNLVDTAAVRTALAGACNRLQAKEEEVAVLLPDPVVRFFVQKFDEFPRAKQEAVALLRWKLRKSLPFDSSEMWLSYMKSPAPEGGTSVATALARLRIIREYEDLIKSVDLHAGVITNSSMAAVAVVERSEPTLLARIADGMMTITVVDNGELRVYRCTELPAQGADLTPQMLLDELYPVSAYFKDVSKKEITSVLLCGLAERFPQFAAKLEGEFQCKVETPFEAARSRSSFPPEAKPLVEQELEGMLGWMMNRV